MNQKDLFNRELFLQHTMNGLIKEGTKEEYIRAKEEYTPSPDKKGKGKPDRKRQSSQYNPIPSRPLIPPIQEYQKEPDYSNPPPSRQGNGIAIPLPRPIGPGNGIGIPKIPLPNPIGQGNGIGIPKIPLPNPIGPGNGKGPRYVNPLSNRLNESIIRIIRNIQEQLSTGMAGIIGANAAVTVKDADTNRKNESKKNIRGSIPSRELTDDEVMRYRKRNKNKSRNSKLHKQHSGISYRD